MLLTGVTVARRVIRRRLFPQEAGPGREEPFEWFLAYDGGLREHLVPFLKSLPSCRR